MSVRPRATITQDSQNQFANQEGSSDEDDDFGFGQPTQKQSEIVKSKTVQPQQILTPIDDYMSNETYHVEPKDTQESQQINTKVQIDELSQQETPEPLPMNPATQDLLSMIQKMGNDGTESKYLAGHVTKALIEDQFMANVDKVIDSDLAINCAAHNKPATFFSQKLNQWRCFQCMLEADGLVYVDKKYKTDMEEYEQIKRACHRVVTENTPNASLISTWKKEVRSSIVQVRQHFDEWIADYTNKFVASLNKIEHSKELYEYADQDRVITGQLRTLQDKYKRILKIFETIQNSEPDQKLDMIQKYKQEMKEIETVVQVQDKQIKSTAVKIKKALRECIDVSNLSGKMLVRYHNYLQYKINQKIEEISKGGRSQNANDRFGNFDLIKTFIGNEKNNADNRLIESYKLIQLEEDSNQPAKNNFMAKQQLLQTKQAQFYDNERTSTVYYLKPNTTNIYLFNEEKLTFLGESLKFSPGQTPQPTPNYSTSVQLVSNDSIYVVGGTMTTSDPRDFILLPYCKMIDANLNVTDKASMKTPRCSIPLALIRDRFILAIGGRIGRDVSCNFVAAYDTVQNVWVDCQPLATPRTNCSAIVLAQRHVYLMPGNNLGAVRGSSLLIEYFDTGLAELNSVDQLTTKKWESLEVNNQSFFRQQPVCGLGISEGDKVVIFGGSGVSQFIFQQQDVDVSKGTLNIKVARGNFKDKISFCNGQDTVIKMYSNKLYALDVSSQMLHIFDQILCLWSSNSLAHYKVPV